jgi:hypothetical protein
LPFWIGAPGLTLNNAYFEAVSGITTTGATVIYGLDDLPPGMNLWRGMLNWLGGLGDRLHRDDLSAADAGRGDAVLPHRRLRHVRQGPAAGGGHRAAVAGRLCRADGACIAGLCCHRHDRRWMRW